MEQPKVTADVTADLVPPDWPHAALSRIIRSRPHRWHVQIAGTGPDLVLIHGTGGAVHSWRDLITPLARTHRVLAVDLPGHGFTRLGTRQRSGLMPMSQDLKTLFATLGVSPSAIIGHSAGAAIALELARSLPGPPPAVISINGALETFPGLAGLLFPLMAKGLALNPFTGSMVAGSMTRKTAERLITGTGSHIDATGIDLYTRLFQSRHHVAGTLSMMAQWSLEPLLPALPELRLPALFMVGGQDLAVAPRCSAAASLSMPLGTLQTYPQAGHLLHEEQPERIARDIQRYLQDTTVA